MKKHTEIGAAILGNSEILMLLMAAEIALSHHEKWDGSGYPRGLAGEAIPEVGRIVAVVDVFDAMVHKRVYKRAISDDEALAWMKEQIGKHFDPRILDCFFSVFSGIRAIRDEVAEAEDGEKQDFPQ
jgi:putative two-component system response regulator